jgi:hypothetical protein
MAATKAVVLKQAVQAVRDVTGLECEPLETRSCSSKGNAFDGVVRLQFQKKQIRQPYVVKRSMNPTTLHLLILQKRESPDGLLLVTAHVNDRQADALRKAGVHFMDASGNVFLNAPGLCLWVSGRRAVRSATPESGVRAFHPSGIQLLFALLTDPNVDSKAPGIALVEKPYRDISAATGISRSTIGWIMADLRDKLEDGLPVTVAP